MVEFIILTLSPCLWPTSPTWQDFGEDRDLATGHLFVLSASMGLMTCSPSLEEIQTIRELAPSLHSIHRSPLRGGISRGTERISSLSGGHSTDKT